MFQVYYIDYIIVITPGNGTKHIYSMPETACCLVSIQMHIKNSHHMVAVFDGYRLLFQQEADNTAEVLEDKRQTGAV